MKGEEIECKENGLNKFRMKWIKWEWTEWKVKGFNERWKDLMKDERI